MKTATTLSIPLTAEQQKQLRETTGKEVPAVKLALELLEQRLAPGLRMTN